MDTICVAGKNNIAVDALEYIVSNYANNYKIVGICNKTDNGMDGFQKSYKKALVSLGIQEVTLDDVYNIDDMLFLSLEFDRLIKTERFKTTRLYNVHFSLLPKYRGMYTAAWVILNSEKETGVTLHKIDNGIDTGDIIDQISYQITDDMNCRDVYLNNIKFGTEIVINNLSNLLDGNFKAIKQDESKSSYYSKSSIDYNNLEISLSEPQDVINRKLRAFSFDEYQKPKYLKDKIIFVR